MATTKRRAAGLGAALALTCGMPLTGCAGTVPMGAPGDEAGPARDRDSTDHRARGDRRPEERLPSRRRPPARPYGNASLQAYLDRLDGKQPAAWSCGYSPTYNDDWHDDVLCTNGIETDRPYLLPSDTFITEVEIMQAAADYEAQLNS